MTELKERRDNDRRLAGRGQRSRSQAEANLLSDAASRSKGQKPGSLELGASPRVNLMPTEVLVDRRQRAVVKRAWAGVVLVAAITAAGVAVATMEATQAKDELVAAQGTTGTLNAQLASYAPLRTMQAETSLLEAAQTVGGSTEIDWSSYLGKVQSSLPSGVTITGVTIDSASPLQAYTQATGPLEGQRVATLAIDASSSTLPSIPAWLDSVKQLKGYVDANTNSVTLDTSSHVYTVNMTIHINEKAFDDKYATKGN